MHFTFSSFITDRIGQMFFRPVVKEVVERYLDCGNPRSGFARIRCPDCHSE
jgi:hypothetical protein